jgi:hypothetical protein
LPRTRKAPSNFGGPDGQLWGGLQGQRVLPPALFSEHRSQPERTALQRPRANPPDKYKVLANALDWTTNIGYPGYATAAIDEAVNTFVLPTIFAKVAREEMNAEDGARAVEKEIRRIFDKWK